MYILFLAYSALLSFTCSSEGLMCSKTLKILVISCDNTCNQFVEITDLTDYSGYCNLMIS